MSLPRRLQSDSHLLYKSKVSQVRRDDQTLLLVELDLELTKAEIA